MSSPRKLRGQVGTLPGRQYPWQRRQTKLKVRSQLSQISKYAEFRGMDTNQIYTAVAHKTGLLYPPVLWNERLEMFDAYFAGDKATGIIARRAARPKRKSKPKQTYAEFTAFYDSKEWRQLRYKVFTLYGRVCACCESVTGPFHIDHIKPRSKHPELELQISNLQVLCEACNMGKGGHDETDWRESDGDLTPEQAAHMREIVQ